MGRAIDENSVGVYHCRAKCVRGDFLCGGEHAHRKNWIWQRLMLLARIFGIDALFVAILDNHVHLILRNRPDVVEQWSDAEVMRRAVLAFPYKFRHFGGAKGPSRRQLSILLEDQDRIKEMRNRLSSISWLMRQLNQKIAKMANAEDGVSGHFWDGRFKSTPILDGVGLMLCAMYVDLNVIRTGQAETPEESEFTSAQARIEGMLGRARQEPYAENWDGWLSPISLLEDEQPGYPKSDSPSAKRATDTGIFDMPTKDYLRLLDHHGRIQAKGKRGKIPDELPPIHERLAVKQEAVEECVANLEQVFSNVAIAGSADEIDNYNRTKCGRQWTQNLGKLRDLFGN